MFVSPPSLPGCFCSVQKDIEEGDFRISHHMERLEWRFGVEGSLLDGKKRVLPVLRPLVLRMETDQVLPCCGKLDALRRMVAGEIGEKNFPPHASAQKAYILEILANGAIMRGCGLVDLRGWNAKLLLHRFRKIIVFWTAADGRSQSNPNYYYSPRSSTFYCKRALFAVSEALANRPDIRIAEPGVRIYSSTSGELPYNWKRALSHLKLDGKTAKTLTSLFDNGEDLIWYSDRCADLSNDNERMSGCLASKHFDLRSVPLKSSHHRLSEEA
ncbi:hypothetical protein P389DRAFT_188058 [Cystobasidium minutum MCA 4210]|uniref:uncharacterized protein n=1 Tax=Cystobasidium minutum MCA 4210 TaxID=1397322 RepID=UPI0034CD21B8|eukprot:jgi/Rhomi1/188058/estExt_fgenesh1_pg.C_2_t10347